MRLTGAIHWEMSALAFLFVYCLTATGVASDSSSTVTLPAPPSLASTAIHQSTPVPKISSSTTKAPVSSSSILATTSSPTGTHAPGPVVKTTAPAPTSSGRKFDGASFGGGIILGVVLTGIFVFAYKWWQSRNKSYHSL